MDNPSISRHIPELDGLRGIAIILVFVFHAVPALPPTSLAVYWVGRVLMQGWVGVELFFVLSGFLITGILLDTRGSNAYFRNFYARRALRIFPLYYAVLVGVLLFAGALNSFALNQFLPAAADRKWYFLYLTNYIAVFKSAPSWDFLWHFWSLAVEEQFYFIWPVFVWLVGARGVRRAAIIGIPTALAFRVAWYLHSGLSVGMLTALPTHMDPLLAGALCATLLRDEAMMMAIRKWLPFTAAIGLGLHAVIAYTRQSNADLDLYTFTLAFTPLSIGFGALVLMCADATSVPVLRNGALRTVGKYAYGLYVFHPLILFPTRVFLLHPKSVTEWLIMLAATWMATFLVAALSYELFERRILGYKRYFEPARAAEQVEEPELALAD